MTRAPLLGLAVLALPVMLAAQQPAAGSANPTTDAAHRMHTHFAQLLTAAADEVPADKLSYKPTEAQMSFGKIWAHLAEANYGVCAGIGGIQAPKLPDRDGTEPKDTLVAALKASFAFCDKALANTDDSKLSEVVPMGFMNGTRALAMFIYIEDLADHYSQVANYMRLNGMLPPSAKPRGN
jgi:DinB superfamily